ncbi:Uncharacterised protein [Salmonella enterica subsp. enterica serovar Bovismorbificans]|uniref:Uncharacterized protein n=1 Tax=Salmonella enterica subsp. enterica serovar Bovismorbificans TaxID=58097 RepID=A0A655ESX1_SALET|nr:Uncharacterised protein [Salmonella enterica subsp. enterica serovar Bovismorbificans]
MSVAIIAFESAMLLFWHFGQRSCSVSWRNCCSCASSLNGITSVVALADPAITSASISITMPGNSLIAPPPGCICPTAVSVHFPIPGHSNRPHGGSG